MPLLLPVAATPSRPSHHHPCSSTTTVTRLIIISLTLVATVASSASFVTVGRRTASASSAASASASSTVAAFAAHQRPRSGVLPSTPFTSCALVRTGIAYTRGNGPVNRRCGGASRQLLAHITTATGFRDDEEEDEEEEEGGQDSISRWERMWERGELDRNIKKALDDTIPSPSPPQSSSSSSTTMPKSEVRVITFDLDNTLWRTGETISHANNVLSKYLQDNGVTVPVRTEVIMGQLFQRDPKRYCPLLEGNELDGRSVKADTNDDGRNGDDNRDGNGNRNGDSRSPTDFDKAAGGESNSSKGGVHISTGPSKPVLLTKLRIDALRDIFIRYNSYPPNDARVAAEEAFDIWTRARHDIIPSHLARDVVQCLDMLRSTIQSKNGGQRVVMGAITDGNSNPRTVPMLEPYFDFVVNSEEVGVAKPDSRVYLAAAERLLDHPHLEDVFVDAMGACKLDDDAVEKTDLLENALGPWWVHVGDDFMKDIVAARELGMRTVWCRELVLNKAGSQEEKESAAKRLNSDDDDVTKKRDVADLVKELAAMKVVEMSIGADEFLADSIHREFADAIVDEFGLIGELLRDWHNVADAASDTQEEEVDVIERQPMEEDIKTGLPDATEGESATAPAPAAEETKFCVYCGTKLPYEANFCSSCGERQPQI